MLSSALHKYRAKLDGILHSKHFSNEHKITTMNEAIKEIKDLKGKSSDDGKEKINKLLKKFINVRNKFKL